MKRLLLTSLLALAAFFAQAKATLEMPTIFANSMILQQDAKVNIWGWADSGQSVKITNSWGEKEIKVTANNNGEWSTTLQTPTYKKGDSHSLTISGDTTIVVKDILFGEVWMTSGQSNMKRHMATILKAYPGMGSSMVKTVDKYKDKIRFFSMSDKIADTPQKNVPEGTWIKTSGATMRGLAAVPFFFAQSLTDSLDVPVGIIWNAWGGSNIQAWMNKESLAQSGSLNPEVAPKKNRISDQNVPYGIYNSKLYPVKNYTIKGFTWYQGESNISTTSVHSDYRKAFKLMVDSWRTLWGDDNLPFYYIQIAPYKYSASENTELPLFVETQLLSLTDLKNVGLVPTGDVGAEGTVHPLKKREVGSRLALLALKETYKVDLDTLPSEGSLFEKVSFQGSKAVVTLKRFGSKHKEGDKIGGFTLSGQDKAFHKAIATVKHKPTRLEISCDSVKKPIAIRYAFKNFCSEANLVDDYGMPSFPYRSDDWDDIK